MKKSDSEEIKSVLDMFKGFEKIGKFEITEKDLKDGVKIMLGESSKILVRPSGTEPLLRIYFETDSAEKLDELKKEVNNIL